MLSLLAFTLATLALLDAAGGIEGLRAAVQRAGPWAPLVYVLLKAATTILAPLSGTPLRLASGALFGLPQGVLLTIAGDVLGGGVSFWISRRFGRDAFRWLVGASGLSQVDALAARAGGWRALLFTRLIIPQVYNYMSYAAGLTALPFRQYLAVTALGGILPTTFTVALGAGLNADRRLLALTYGALAAFALLILLARRRIARSADRH